VGARTTETRPPDGFPASSFRYTPLRHLRVLFVNFTQGLFNAAPPGNFHWDPDPTMTEIVITDESTIRRDAMQQRPAITFTRGPMQLYSRWMDDMLGFDFRTEAKTKSVLVPGTMSVNCLSRVDLESEEIAWVVAEHFWLLRELLMKMGFFDIGRGISISSPSPAGSIVTGDQGDEISATTLTIPFQFYRTSTFTPLGRQVAQNINLALSLVARGMVPKSAAVSDHEFALNEHECFPPPFAPDATDVYGGTPNPGGERNQDLPLVPHPLNPAKLVKVRTVRGNQPGGVRPNGGPYSLPITDPCKRESGG
jgi:hypothetical protein